MNRKFAAIAVAAAVAGAVTLSACATETGSVGDESAGSNAEATTEATAEATNDEGGEAEASPANPVFGDTYTYDNGLAVTVGEPTEFTPSEFAAAGEATAYLAFEFKVVNNTGENFDPALFFVTAQSGNAEAEQVFDTEQGFEGSPTTQLLDGREAVFTLGFGVDDPTDIVMEVNPDSFTYESVIFTN